MIYYQPTVETFKYSWVLRRNIQDKLYPSTIIFPSFELAEQYKCKFINGLKNRGLNLKDGTFSIYNAELIIPESQPTDIVSKLAEANPYMTGNSPATYTGHRVWNEAVATLRTILGDKGKYNECAICGRHKNHCVC